MVSCGVMVVVAVFLSIYATDWIIDRPVIGNSLDMIAMILIADALISWACARYPWDWPFVVWSAVSGA
jgi:hypothetical protein